jgi:hypothetical protein
MACGEDAARVVSRLCAGDGKSISTVRGEGHRR